MIAAIVPAAGLSARMGRPKLMLPIDGQTVIARVVAALRQGGVATVVVVVPPADAPGAAHLVRAAEGAGGTVVVAPSRPPDMRASFELGLVHLEGGLAPATVLLAPGDSVGITSTLVAAVVAKARAHPARLIVPVVGGTRGHPVALPWRVAREVFELPPDQGVNALVRARGSEVVTVETDDAGAVADLDTPDDYRRWGGPREDEP